jgi:hypothetical protein
MTGEGTTATAPNKLPDGEMPDTTIADFTKNPLLHAQLTEKLVKYRRYAEDVKYKAPDLVFQQYGVDPLFITMKEKVLETVLQLAEDQTRDFTQAPLTIGEIAQIITEDSRYELSAGEIPFVWDGMMEQYIPDYEHLVAEANRETFAFAQAYEIVRGYTNGYWEHFNGGGLPDIEVPTSPEASN